MSRRVSSLVYGRGLCFGMAVGALGACLRDEEIADLPASPELLGYLRRLHLTQFRPLAVLEMARRWSGARGAKGGVSPDRIQLPDSGEPHILCLGPSLSGSFLNNLGGSHAVVPYRTEVFPGGARVYVYDPNYPGRRDRFVTFGADGGFFYGGFSTAGGWGVYPVSLSVVSPALRRGWPGARPRS